MEIEFESDELASIYLEGKVPKGYQPSIIKAFIKTVRQLENANKIEDLYKFQSLRFKALSGNKKGLFAARVNDQYLIEFKYKDSGNVIVITILELSNHYT